MHTVNRHISCPGKRSLTLKVMPCMMYSGLDYYLEKFFIICYNIRKLAA
jgi:hypothetical protein